MSAPVFTRHVGTAAMVSITAHVPEDAMSAGLLGTERSGHGVKIRDDGLIATIGYVVHEAESLWIGNKNAVVPGFVVGQDFDSGLALVKPSLPLQGPSMALGRADALNIGDTVSVMSSGGRAQVIEARDIIGSMIIDTEEHIDWFEKQLRIIKQVGAERYLSEQIKKS